MTGKETGGLSGDLDVMSTIKDPNVKEIVAKESLQVKLSGFQKSEKWLNKCFIHAVQATLGRGDS